MSECVCVCVVRQKHAARAFALGGGVWAVWAEGSGIDCSNAGQDVGGHLSAASVETVRLIASMTRSRIDCCTLKIRILYKN